MLKIERYLQDSLRRFIVGAVFPLALAALVVIGFTGPAQSAQEHAKEPTADDLVQTQLLSDVGAVAPGSTFHIAVRYRIAPHWHIYWNNPGDSGVAPGISIEAPEGFEVGNILWPRPQVFRGKDEVTYGYEKEVLLIVPVKAPEQIQEPTVTFEVALDWLVCKKVCLMGMREQELKLDVTLKGRMIPAPGTASREVSTWLGRMPAPMSKIKSATARLEQSNLLLAGPAGASRPALFYPEETPGVTLQAAGPVKGTVVNGRYAFNIPLKIEPENALGKPLRVAGIVVLGPDKGGRAIRIDIPVPAKDVAEANETSSE